MKVRTLIAAALLWMLALHAHATDCKTQVVAKNPTGALRLGAIKHPPKGSDFSVWLGVYPEAIAVDSERNIYVGDSVNYRVIKFDKTGSVVRSFRLKPPVRTKRPEVSHIIDAIALDRHDNVYVNNALEKRVEIYSKSGKFMRAFVYGDSSISSIEDMRVSEKGEVELIGMDRIMVYSSSGSVLSSAPADQGNGAKDMAGRLSNYHFSGDALVVTTRNGGPAAQCHLSRVNPVIKTSGNGTAGAVDADGNFYTIDQDTLSVVRIVVPGS